MRFSIKKIALLYKRKLVSLIYEVQISAKKLSYKKKILKLWLSFTESEIILRKYISPIQEVQFFSENLLCLYKNSLLSTE